MLSKVRETLAGRTTLLSLWPFALIERGEWAEVPDSLLDLIWTRGAAALADPGEPTAADARTWRGHAEHELSWGGYPPVGQMDEDDRETWLRDYRSSYLERDLADLGRVADLDQFALAQNLFAARTSQLLSYSEVARELGVAVNTVKRYLRFLEISYRRSCSARWRRPPRAGSSRARSSTGPTPARLLSGRLGAQGDGAMFETYVLDELVRWCSWQRRPPDLSFLRVHGGREIDFLLHGRGRLVAARSAS